MKLRSTLAPLVILLSVLGPAQAAVYYVATTGSDSNPGTQSSPFRHLSKAALTAKQPGDTVMVADGTYDNEGVVEPNFVVTLYYSGTAAAPITFMAQNRGQAILDSMNTSTTATCNGAAAYFNLANASHVVIQGFVMQRGCDSGIQSNGAAHDITIRWNEIRNIANRTVTDQIGRDGIYLNSSEYNFTFDGNVFHDIGRTDGQSMLHFDHGIYTHATGLTVINNIFYNMNRGWSLQLADGAKNYLVANNTFAFGNANGESGQIMYWGSNSNITIRNNIFYKPNGSALNQYAAAIIGNIFEHNLTYGVTTIMLGGILGITVGTNQIGADPQFVNASSYDFHTQAGSPAIDAGMNLSAVPVDIAGTTRPQGASADLGAYEYVAPVTRLAVAGVFTSNITYNSAIANWSSNVGSTSYVQYGISGYTNTTTENLSMVAQHSVALSNLQASTLYHYRVASHDASGSLVLSTDYTFTTPAAPFVNPTFSLSPAGPAISVAQGQSGSDAITATLLTGSPAAVSFAASSLPVGVSASFSAASCTIGCSTTMNIAVSATAVPGTYTLVVNGTGGGAASSTNIVLTVPAPAALLAASNATSGLVAEWKLNETSGTVAHDATNTNNGTVNNGYWWASAHGPSLWLNGTASYVSVPENAGLEQSNQLTVTFWLDPNANSNLDPRVVSKLYDWDIKLSGANHYPQISAAGQYAVLNYSLPLNAWHHVAFTFSTGTVAGYVDGVPVPFLQNTFIGTETLAQWAYGLFLGTDASQSNSLIGSLQDVRVYNRALTATDVAAIYAATK